jgi:hypothetical protein
MTLTSPQERRAAHHPQPGPEDAPSPREIKYRQDAAQYVAAMLTELRQIAGKAGFDKLVASLDAAYYDAYAARDSHNGSATGEASKNFSHAMEPNGG